MKYIIAPAIGLCLVIAGTATTMAQSTGGTATEAEATDAVATDGSAEDTEGLLTQAELETLMAPVALYPDTLLIQVLVAATYPLEVVKSSQFLEDNADADPEVLKTDIEAQGWDPSVAVLATAFPTVTTDMAANLDWTETVGDAMLVQSDDVLAAVQTLRDQAIETGALVSGEAQTVETDADNNVVIAPTNPEVVYVPEYDSKVVYDNSLGDAVAAGAMAFGTFVVLDAIFDDDDYWNNGYWGCRTCGGWGGNPIIRNPDIDIGDVNIGNNVGNRIDRPGEGWKPDPDRKKDARDNLSKKRGDGGPAKLPAKKPAGRGDDLRKDLSARSGAKDIARPESRGNLPQIDRPGGRPSGAKAETLNKTKQRPAAGKAKPNVKKPAAKPKAKSAAANRPAAKKKAKSGGSAVKRHQSGGKARASSNRGRSSGGGRKGRR